MGLDMRTYEFAWGQDGIPYLKKRPEEYPEKYLCREYELEQGDGVAVITTDNEIEGRLHGSQTCLIKGCMNMKQLMTKWADNINEKNVLRGVPKTAHAQKKLCKSERNMEICNKRNKRISKENGWGYPGSVFRRKLYCRG